MDFPLWRRNFDARQSYHWQLVLYKTEFSAVIDRIAPRYTQYKPLRHAVELMLGMVSELVRKNCWTIAEHRGQTRAVACSTCCRGRNGTPRQFVTIYATTSSTPSGRNIDPR